MFYKGISHEKIITQPCELRIVLSPCIHQLLEKKLDEMRGYHHTDRANSVLFKVTRLYFVSIIHFFDEMTQYEHYLTLS